MRSSTSVGWICWTAWLLLTCLLCENTAVDLPSRPFIPDYGVGSAGNPTGEARYVIGQRYFVNDDDWAVCTRVPLGVVAHLNWTVCWQVSTLAGAHTPTTRQISGFGETEKLYQVAAVRRALCCRCCHCHLHLLCYTAQVRPLFP